VAKNQGLTAKQSHFVLLYSAESNASKAAIGAGYSEKTARTVAARLLAKSGIREAIHEQRDCLVEKQRTTIAKTIREYARIGFSDIRQLFDNKGKLLPLSDWTPGIAGAVQSLEVVTHKNGRSKINKIRLYPKVAALDTIAKHLGMLVDRHEVTVNVERIERIDSTCEQTTPELEKTSS